MANECFEDMTKHELIPNLKSVLYRRYVCNGVLEGCMNGLIDTLESSKRSIYAK